MFVWFYSIIFCAIYIVKYISAFSSKKNGETENKYCFRSSGLFLTGNRSSNPPLLRYFDKKVNVGLLIFIKSFILIGVEFLSGDRSVVPALALKIPPELLSRKDPSLSGIDLIEGKEDLFVGEAREFFLRIVPAAALRKDIIAGEYLLLILERLFPRFLLFLFFRSLFRLFLSLFRRFLQSVQLFFGLLASSSSCCFFLASSCARRASSSAAFFSSWVSSPLPELSEDCGVP